MMIIIPSSHKISQIALILTISKSPRHAFHSHPIHKACDLAALEVEVLTPLRAAVDDADLLIKSSTHILHELLAPTGAKAASVGGGRHAAATKGGGKGGDPPSSSGGGGEGGSHTVSSSAASGKKPAKKNQAHNKKSKRRL